MNEPQEWNIDKNKLVNYKKKGWTEDYFASTPNNKFGLLVYNIEEWRMLSYAGLFAIYSNHKNPELELNSGETWIWFDNEKTFSFLEKSECIACRKPAYNPNSSKGDFPFIIINLNERKFGFIEFDYTSIYYGLKETEKNQVKLIEVHPRDLESLKSKRTDEIFDLKDLRWFDLVHFDSALEKYNEK